MQEDTIMLDFQAFSGMTLEDAVTKAETFESPYKK